MNSLTASPARPRHLRPHLTARLRASSAVLTPKPQTRQKLPPPPKRPAPHHAVVYNLRLQVPPRPDRRQHHPLPAAEPHPHPVRNHLLPAARRDGLRSWERAPGYTCRLCGSAALRNLRIHYLNIRSISSHEKTLPCGLKLLTTDFTGLSAFSPARKPWGL